MALIATADCETQSYADLTQVGAWAYSEDPTTNVICMCWGIDNRPIGEWSPFLGDHVIPEELEEVVLSGGIIEAHNVAFERSIWANILTPRFGWPLPGDDQWADTMAVAAYLGLPMKLDRLAHALQFQGKDPEGGRLITKYSKLHLKTAKKDIPPDDLRKFIDYCRRDVQLEQSVSDFMGPLPDTEMEIFRRSQRTNMRGLLLDIPGIMKATEIVEKRSLDLEIEFEKLTGLKPTQRDKVMAWMLAQGLTLDNMQADYLEELLEEGDLPQGPARRALEIRLAINKASTKKLDAMARQAGKDGRARWQTRYHGASTGRETGTGLQPLNMNRGYDKMNPDQLVRDIMYGDPEWLDLLYGNAMDAVAKASRHWIKAAPGKKLLAGDFVSIEAVVLACLAGETWKVDAFRNGVKIYEHMADKIYKLPPGTVTKETHPLERQDGKTGELACGYQGSLGAWLKFDDSGRHSDEAILGFVKMWRAEHPMTTQFWREMESSALAAVDNPGKVFGYRAIEFEVKDEWLTMRLPNGKRLWYFHPKITVGMPAWHQPAKKEECAKDTCSCSPVPKLSYMATKEGQWKRVYTYGGKLTENATQATSREILMPAIQRAEKAGYTTILSVYDEIVCEVPKDFGAVKEFEEIMRQSPGEWAAGWPINVEAWEGERYKK